MTIASKPKTVQKQPFVSVIDRLAYGECTSTVYVAWDGASVKIGRTTNISSRIRSMQTGHDRDICVYWAVRLSQVDAVQVEASIHHRLRPTINHKRGEWYALDPRTAVDAVMAEILRAGVPSREDIEFGVAQERF